MSLQITDHRLSPPTKKLIFEDNVTQDDNSFVQYLISRYAISADEADRFIDSMTAKIRTLLASGEQVTLAGLGVLSQTKDGVKFSPVSSNFHPDFLYLPTLSLDPLDEIKDVKKPILSPEKTKTTKIGRVSAISSTREPIKEEIKDRPGANKVKMDNQNNNRNSYYYEDDKTLLGEIGWPLFWLLLLLLSFVLLSRYGCAKMNERSLNATDNEPTVELIEDEQHQSTSTSERDPLQTI